MTPLLEDDQNSCPVSLLNPGSNLPTGPVHAKVLAVEPILWMPLGWTGLGASAMKQMSDQSLHFLEDGLAWVVGFVQAVWRWSADQIVRMTQAPWDSWPLWKQILLVIVAALVVYALFIAAKQLWWAALNVLSAVASFVGTLLVTLPTILLAGAIALAGLWVINNFHNLSSLRSIMTIPGGEPDSTDGNGTTPPAATKPPTDPTGGR